MKESKGWVIAFLAAIVFSAAGSLAYHTGVFSKKTDAVKADSSIVYERHYKSNLQVLSNKGGRDAYSACRQVGVDIMVKLDTIVLSSPYTVFGYKPLGVDSEGGLHAVRQDSSQVIFYRYRDKRDTSKHILYVHQPETDIVFFELPTCPEIGK